MKNWEKKKLSEICDFGNGLWTGKKPPFQNVGVIRNTNFTKDGKLDDSDIVYLDVEQSQFAKRKLQYGDIILEKSGGGPKQPVGRVIIFDKKKGDFSFSNFTSVIRIVNPKTVDFTYLHRFLFFSYVSGATETMQSHSTGIRNLKFEDYKAIEIPLPPLPEQQSIVAILDEAFAAIAKAKVNAEQNLKNAKELFESYLQGVFKSGDENWETKCLDELGTITSSKRIYKSEYVKDGVPFYRTKEIKELSNGKNISLELFISRERYNEIKNSFGVPQINDLLMSAVGTIGEIMVVENDEEFYFKDGNIVWFKEFKSLDTNYLKFALTAFVENIKSLAIGAAYNALTIEKLNKYQISYPKSIVKQQTIVQKIDALASKTKKLEAIYQQKINDLEELKKSVLQKAFSGELTKK